MSIANAQSFLKKASASKELRDELNGMKTEEVFPYLKSEELEFSPEEFNETVNMMHVQCKTQEEAEDLMQTVFWFKILSEDFTGW